jgi:prepilin-type N-terminal cleavage/methylation domain-containing protein
MKNNQRRNGFSLLELLVVIGIIGILVSVGTVAYRSAQERARDSRRRGDIEAVSKALEQFYADNLSYPLATDCTGYGAYLVGATPSDPQTGDDYVVDGDCAVDGSQFCVCALLESEDTGNAFTKSGPGSACVWSGGSGTMDYYCAQNQQ